MNPYDKCLIKGFLYIVITFALIILILIGVILIASFVNLKQDVVENYREMKYFNSQLLSFYHENGRWPKQYEKWEHRTLIGHQECTIEKVEYLGLGQYRLYYNPAHSGDFYPLKRPSELMVWPVIQDDNITWQCGIDSIRANKMSKKLLPEECRNNSWDPKDN